MKIKIIRDVDFFDEKIRNMNPYKRKLMDEEIFVICKTARRLRNEGKISQITNNRIQNLWTFQPSTMLTSYQRRLFRFKEPNLIYIQNALNKMFKALSEEGTL